MSIYYQGKMVPFKQRTYICQLVFMLGLSPSLEINFVLSSQTLFIFQAQSTYQI